MGANILGSYRHIEWVKGGGLGAFGPGMEGVRITELSLAV